jgi:CBS domain-containing protein
MSTARTTPPLVRDRMISPAISCAPETNLEEIVALLEQRRISAVPIVEAEGMVGVVSTTDIVARSAAPAKARDIMTTFVVTASPEEPLADAARRLVAARVHRLFVVDEDRLVGVLSVRDLLSDVKASRLTMPIGSAMTTPVETIEVGDSIEHAVSVLQKASVHGLVVVDGNSPVGVFTHAEAIAARRLPPSFRRGTVEDLMSYETICLDVDTPVYRAAAYAMAMDVRRILAVHRRDLAGILSAIDLVSTLRGGPFVLPSLPVALDSAGASAPRP